MQLASGSLFKLATCLVTASFIAACSSPERARQAERGFKYLDSELLVPLSTPEGVNPPAYSDEFAVPPLGEQANNRVGGDVDVRPPVQVLNVVSGSRFEVLNSGVIFWFDIPQSQGEGQSRELMDQLLNDYVAGRGGRFQVADAQAGIWLSDWIVDESKVDGRLWGSKTHRLSQRFQYSLQIMPHGRTAGFSVELIDVNKTIENEPAETVFDSFERRRLANIELNQLIGFIAEQREQYEQQLQLEREQAQLAAMNEQEVAEYFDESVSVLMIENAGVANFRADADLDKTMKRLREILPLLGFEITDYVSNTGKLYLKRKSPSNEIRQRYGLEDLKFRTGDFVMTLGSSGDNTLMTLADGGDAVLSADVLHQLYPYFAIMMKRGDTPLN
nr:outer membrane protein assembly factor BamC [Aliagarivorans marinus]